MRKSVVAFFSRFLFAAVFVVVGGVFIDPSLGAAQTKSQTESQSEESRQDAQLRERIQDRLSKTTATLRKLSTSIQRTQDKMAKLEREIKKLRQKEQRLKAKLSENVQKHHLAMANLARLERQPLRALLAYDVLKIQPQRQPIMAISRKAMNKRIESNREKLADLLHITQEKEIHQGQLTTAQARLRASREELANLQEQQQQFLSLPPRERQQLKKQAQKIAKLGNVEELLDISNALTGIQPPTDLSQQSENLPFKGVITTRFGEMAAQSGMHTAGIKIQGIGGQKVKAIRDGRILYAGPFKGFGFLVIMEHADGHHSLYGGMEEADTTVGRYLSAGDVIGTLPEKDTPKLYLEVRENGKPTNPKPWLMQDG